MNNEQYRRVIQNCENKIIKSLMSNEIKNDDNNNIKINIK
jgi:hypothetical protein